jgi:DnaJ-class molecular chaperone
MAVKYKDYYETLGVAKTATPEEIKPAFRKLARIHHPDVAKNKAAGEAQFKEINEAYEVLGDADKRGKYDEMGANWRRPPQVRPTAAAGRRELGCRRTLNSAEQAIATSLSHSLEAARMGTDRRDARAAGSLRMPGEMLRPTSWCHWTRF